MSPEEILSMIVAAQHIVIMARRDRVHTELRFGSGGATWADVTARIDDVDAAVNERDALLYAAVAHDQEWAHIFDDCPICQARS